MARRIEHLHQRHDHGGCVILHTTRKTKAYLRSSSRAKHVKHSTADSHSELKSEFYPRANDTLSTSQKSIQIHIYRHAQPEVYGKRQGIIRDQRVANVD